MPAFLNIFRSLPSAAWRRLLIAFAAVAIPVTVFVKIAGEVRERETLGVDDATLRAINGLATPQMNAVMVVVTQLGGVVGVVVLTAGLTALLTVRKMYRMAVFLLASVGGAVVLNLILKTLFQRDRPQLWERLVTENSYSFPSGHAMGSSALALAIIVICWPTRWRYLALSVATFYVLIIGFSRLYLGVHYPTDIVAGWAVSAAWVGAVAIALRYHRWFRRETVNR